MTLLAIETATELVGVTVADDDGPRATVWTTGRRRHAESLAPAIAHVLDQAGLSLGDLDAVAVDVGPGLFTGLRVGVATAKGLAQGLRIGVIELTSLEVLARAAYDAGWPGPVAAVVDARRGEVFVARYRPGGGLLGAVTETSPPARFTPEDLVTELSGEEGMLAVGDGARRYASVLGAIRGLRIAGPASPPPDALAVLAAERLAAGVEVRRPEQVRPLYLREADAQINWVQRQGVER